MSWLRGFDRKIFNFTLRFTHESFAHKYMRFISRSGNFGIIWLFACLCLMSVPENRRIVELCLITLLFTTVLGEGILKHIFRRPRPFITHGPVKMAVPAPTSFSFPSGHTASSVACARILSMINPVVAVIACAYAFLMGCSRVYLKTHYVTDVIAGGLIGLICAEAVKWFFK
ncbi:MAG: phosphatase PAP2 family protein [Peptococcaceae bacterium]|nr:phosphatase PAP2 family protein [Peptococcaceae bacterium]